MFYLSIFKEIKLYLNGICVSYIKIFKWKIENYFLGIKVYIFILGIKVLYYVYFYNKWLFRFLIVEDWDKRNNRGLVICWYFLFDFVIN